MPRLAGEDLEKVTMNLFAKDVAWLRRKAGYGWTEFVREIVHQYVKTHTQMRDTGMEDDL